MKQIKNTKNLELNSVSINITNGKLVIDDSKNYIVFKVNHYDQSNPFNTSVSVDEESLSLTELYNLKFITNDEYQELYDKEKEKALQKTKEIEIKEMKRLMEKYKDEL